jgi:hypothetical protein
VAGFREHVCRPDTGGALDLELKPGQKVDAFTYIPVPAKGDIEKLVIQSGDNRVLRYALTGKVKPLDALYADPDDKTGFSAREEFVGKMGTAFQLPLYPWNPGSALDMVVERVATLSEPVVADEELPEGSKNLVVWLRVKNVGASEATVNGETFSVRARMDDGSAVQSTGGLLHATAKRTLEDCVEIEKGAETTVRVCIQIPKDATPKALVIAGHLDELRRWVIPL